MKEVFESFLGIFFLLLLMVTGMSVISASITAKNADANLSAYVAEIEESNFSKSVMEAVFEDAADRGYRMKMILYDEDDTGAMSTRTVEATDVLTRDAQGNYIASIPGSTFDCYMVQIVVSFDYNFSLYNNVTQHTLYRFAR